MGKVARAWCKLGKEKAGHAMVILDVPLLFETGWDKRVDKTIVVSAPFEVQKAR